MTKPEPIPLSDADRDLLILAQRREDGDKLISQYRRGLLTAADLALGITEALDEWSLNRIAGPELTRDSMTEGEADVLRQWSGM
jgi:predicted lipid carrier protein YhbT